MATSCGYVKQKDLAFQYMEILIYKLHLMDFCYTHMKLEYVDYIAPTKFVLFNCINTQSDKSVNTGLI